MAGCNKSAPGSFNSAAIPPGCRDDTLLSEMSPRGDSVLQFCQYKSLLTIRTLLSEASIPTSPSGLLRGLDPNSGDLQSVRLAAGPPHFRHFRPVQRNTEATAQRHSPNPRGAIVSSNVDPRSTGRFCRLETLPRTSIACVRVKDALTKR